MNIEEEYRLQMYKDLGPLGSKKEIRLKRNKIYGNICVEKRVSPELKHIYDFLKNSAVEGVPNIHECILDGNVLIVIEEYITGRTLEAVIRESQMKEEEVVRIALEICSILKVLHSAVPAIICRDIKAENIMIDQKGQVWLVDFNIARTFQKGKKRDTVILGTAEYAAPEQFGFFQTDNRTDIYALGVLINYMSIEEVKEEILQLYPLLKENDTSGKARHSFVLPGFRSNVFWKKAVAVVGYLFIIWFCFSLEIKSEKYVMTWWMVRIEQTIIFFSQLLFVVIVSNYRGCRDEIPFFKTRNKYIHIAGYVIVEVILLFEALLICGICDSIFRGVC